MPKGNFSICSYGQEFTIESTAISTQGDAASPYLFIPVNLDLIPAGSGKDKTCFIITNIEAYITFDGIRFKASEINKICNIEVKDKRNWSLTLEFPLDANKISIIEMHRKNNISFNLWMTFHYGVYTTLKINTDNGVDFKDFISQYSSVNERISIEIPHSHWVNKILPGLGFKAFRLIEMPMSSNLIPKEFSQSITELNEAEKYFNNGDYDKTVAHCRSALDPLKDKLQNLKQFITSKSEFDWINKVNESTYNWLDILLKNTRGFTSKTHHPPSIGHFDKHDAEIIFMITTAVIAYTGRVEINSKK